MMRRSMVSMLTLLFTVAGASVAWLSPEVRPAFETGSDRLISASLKVASIQNGGDILRLRLAYPQPGSGSIYWTGERASCAALMSLARMGAESGSLPI